ncbi:MAG: hypothetical protein JXJ20_11425 [Anaerolineae bacterium]|nr:hypothetical protein [Anaerolineae bacterium]
MFKKRLVLYLVLLMLCTLMISACGGDDGSDDSGDDGNDSPPKVELAYQGYQLQVTQANLQDEHTHVDTVFRPVDGQRFLRVTVEIVSKEKPQDSDWEFTVIDEAGNESPGDLNQYSVDADGQVYSFTQIMPVSDQAKEFTLDINGEVQVDLTPILTDEPVLQD